MLEAPHFLCCYQPCLFQDAEMFHDAEPCHVELTLQVLQGLAVLRAQTVQQGAARRVGKGFEYRIHVDLICDSLVT